MGIMRLTLICLRSRWGLTERFFTIAPCWVPAGMLNCVVPLLDLTLVVQPRTASKMSISTSFDLEFRYFDFLLLKPSLNSTCTIKSPNVPFLLFWWPRPFMVIICPFSIPRGTTMTYSTFLITVPLLSHYLHWYLIVNPLPRHFLQFLSCSLPFWLSLHGFFE